MALTKINASVIANNTIAVGNIADNSVDATKIASNSILTRHIDDNQIGIDQLNVSDGSNGQFLKTDGSGTMSFGTVSTTTALDDIATGDAAATLATSSGDITLDTPGDIILDADGGQVIFKDGGSSIGEIQQVANDLTIYSSTSGHNGLRFHANGILPTDNAGAIVNNDADLGDASYRFKDLYLSNDIHINDDGVIKLGDTNGDFELYHIGGSINVIRGSNGLVLQSDDTSYGIQMGTYSGGETMFKAVKNGAVSLYHDNAVKLSTTSTGIAFNGDTSAANSLDDYEEGTWTPAIYTYGGVTTSSSSMYGIYTKIGNICHIHCKISATLSSLPGQNWVITGLPFSGTSTNDANQRAIFAVGGDCVNTGGNTPKAHFRIAANELHGIYFNASNNTAYWTYNTMDSTAFEMNIHGFYTTT